MKLAVQLLASFLFSVVFFGLALFLPAGTLDYWQAWVYLVVFVAATLLPSLYLAVKHPAALQRRMKGGPTAETRPVQRVVMVATVLAVLAQVVVSALDHRFGWSSVPVPVVVLGDVLVGAGLLLAQCVVIQNGYAAATITVEADQPLVSTGLYGLVRHPMYLGALVMMVGAPLALDSYWGLALVFPGCLALAVRIGDEEKMLRDELVGYDDYVRRVRFRLVPGVW
ncbi:isoprenylcysteine carboxylmethyltransferase family protein [Mycobacterium yunnanensis]|uniref:Isoprenylcysteine carboxylmethyltransferase family protein n=1 Tax=Mycobacterium yunnanensis TaxID=368477 RepID=A0A9X2YY47_9MYCO|nr:isoprenylcysteine carboxylmethyltransferase family protein [Mycobacterium yunnanensis]MCV7419805.1 isoprenylcysteine carboxylmethyltransferase family protein [Mycobacterium yunnanensis]